MSAVKQRHITSIAAACVVALGALRVTAEDVDPGFVTELLYLFDELPGVNKSEYLSPDAFAVSPDGKTLYVAEKTSRQVAYVDIASGEVTNEVLFPNEVTGIAVAPDGARLYVTCSSGKRPQGVVCVVNASSGAIETTILAGHSTREPVVSPDGAELYVCNRFDNEVAVIDLASNSVAARIPVVREATGAAITDDGSRLVVTNYLPIGRADLDTVQCPVSIIDTDTRAVVANVLLANGAHSLQDVAVSPKRGDGKYYAYVTHPIARFQIPPNEIQRGWITSNALSVINVTDAEYVNVVPLDDNQRGVANPWGIACTGDGASIVISHAGSHDAVVIDADDMHAKLDTATQDLSYNLLFSQSFRTRLALDVLGPRPVAIVGTTAYIGGYFSDDIQIVDLSSGTPSTSGSIALGPSKEMDQIRFGELRFFDARICFQRWQSCHSCHPNTRTDMLNWDLLNDGIGNPKSDKSMLLAHITPPAMISGVRDSAEVAVRAGVLYILFAEPVETDALAMDEYLKSLRPVPSPYLVKGMMSDAAKRGKGLFYDKFQCQQCHPEPLYTDLRFHNVGTQGPLDTDGRSEFDTPTLIENWRTAPYLHDGRYPEMKDVYSPGRHGLIVNATDQEIQDLVEFVNSL
ncbi:MAG: cell surface protein [Chitinivibrionales bacterium]|nr:cell surface protein [Chitinivibrionales bacterium]MBD3396634.1 cell surface protein [Chitinivibrionales bacterium]